MEPDAWLVDPESLAGGNWKTLVEKRHRVLGIALVAIGVYALYSNFIAPVLWGMVSAYHLQLAGHFAEQPYHHPCGRGADWLRRVPDARPCWQAGRASRRTTMSAFKGAGSGQKVQEGDERP